MPTAPEARQRLAAAMDARRSKLGLTWQDVADASGLSLKTLYNVRVKDDAEVTTLTAGKIDAGLRWQPGSAAAILGGGEPVPDGVLEEMPRPQDHPAPGRPQLAEVPHAGADDMLIARFIATRPPIDEGGDREVLEAMWRQYLAGVQPRDVVVAKILDFMGDDPGQPADWDKPADGRDHANHA